MLVILQKPGLTNMTRGKANFPRYTHRSLAPGKHAVQVSGTRTQQDKGFTNSALVAVVTKAGLWCVCVAIFYENTEEC